jgi:hypothetical protein
VARTDPNWWRWKPRTRRGHGARWKAEGAGVTQRTGPTAARPTAPPGRGAAESGPAAAAPTASAGIRLTGRGAMLGIFVVCFFGLVISDWLHWGMTTGGAFVVATGVAAARTQRTDLLTVAVSPPALFLAAVVCGKALLSSGSVLLSTTEGTLITLANTAPWLIAGTLLSLIIAFSRGLWDNVRVLGKELRGDPTRKTATTGQAGTGRPSG